MADRNGYIGRAPSDSSVVVARQTFSPTGVTTDFTFASGYTVGYLDAYLNGVRLIEGLDYNATNGSIVGLSSAAQDGDVLELVAYKAFNVGNVTDAAGNFNVGNDLTVGGDLTVIGDSTFVDLSIRNLTGVAATFTGVVTYEDVTNVDSIGLITARTGIQVLAGGIDAVGVVTGTSFSGSGSGLTGVSTNFVSAIGIQSAGTVIGAGITQLNFIGVGNTFAVNGTTVDISIQGSSGSGGITSLDITSSLFV